MLYLFKYRGVFAIVFLALMFIGTNRSLSQPTNTVRGTVLDKETGEPIPTVHVYISQTTEGTTTKFDGTFEFRTELAGVHTLVFSFVGYQTHTEEVNFYADNHLYFEVELTPKAIELDPLEITASNKEWQKNFEIFRKNFIGETSVARNTKIENPWVISFETDDEENLRAKADRPIEIINQDLGYEIKVDLVEFTWPKSGEIGGYYLFYISYSELDPENGRERRKWERNRREIYEGSFQHFLKSLYEDDLKENDFDVVLAGTNN
ncbi:MAG: carboxypeptidase-like regulatory domain-containing protein, partial [Balneolaceae bacterium]|nr:carboxypeptidase-like regulatory domain-containing protein [Balneolaceae bacterium]